MQPVFVAIALGSIWMSGGALAAPSSMVRQGLNQAQCMPASQTEVFRSKRTIAYDVVCRGAEARRLTLVCTPRGCFPDEDHQPDDDE